MRYIHWLFFAAYFIIDSACAQTVSGVSQPTRLNVNSVGTTLKRSFNISDPVKLRITSNSLFSGLSESIPLKMGVPASEKQVTTAVNTEIETSNSDLEDGSPNFYALLIGINEYAFNTPELLDLNKAVNDAERLQRLLTSEYQFDETNTFFIKDATRKQIINQLEKLAGKLSSQDNLLVFYAGHGVWDDRINVGYWLPSDAKVSDKSTWLSNSTVRDYIAGIDSKHTLLITDACFSGSIFKTREVSLSDFGMASLYKLPSRKAMTSGTLTAVPDESQFMKYLLKRLDEHDGKFLSARQLFYGLETAVINNSNTIPQYGVIQDAGDEGGDFIFIRR